MSICLYQLSTGLTEFNRLDFDEQGTLQAELYSPEESDGYIISEA